MGIGFTKWAVYKNGRDIGIIETNYPWARTYWKNRAMATGERYKLIGIH